MRELAIHFGEPQDTWGLTGLLHDFDYEETVSIPERHTQVTEELLKEYDLPPEIMNAIKCHNNKAPRESLLDKAIYAADPVTGLIVAAALMHPEKKLKALDAEFILRRFREKSFAKGASREQIMTCEEMGLGLPEFMELSLKAMQSIHDDLGL